MKSLEERLKDREARNREAERQRDALAGILAPQKPEADTKTGDKKAKG